MDKMIMSGLKKKKKKKKPGWAQVCILPQVSFPTTPKVSSLVTTPLARAVGQPRLWLTLVSVFNGT